jgi:uncharacterized protein (DUF1800 family)
MVWHASFTLLLAVGVASVNADPLASSARPDWSADKARHLLRRAAFGGTPEQVLELLKAGRDGAVDLLLNYEATPQADSGHPLEDFVDRPGRRIMSSLSEEQRREFFQVIQRITRVHGETLKDWWLRRMVVSPRPFEERMTLFWHGHFTSGMREVRNPAYMYRQNEFLRQHALGPFKDLVKGISRDAAMLAYLDNGRNVKGRPNENYARELMELFTMGVGNYTEDDVKQAARAFTGWTTDERGDFHVRDRQHDNGVKTFLGKTGSFDGDDIVDIIFEQPATARHLAGKLWTAFVEPDPDEALLDALAARIRENDYDLRATMRLIFRSDAFYAMKARAALIRSPVELVVGAARSLEAPLDDLQGANRQMQTMGQELFQPPNVKGWDGGRTWITTSTLFIRYNTLGALIDGSGGRGNVRPPGRARAIRALAGAATSSPAMATMEGDDSALLMGAERLPAPAREWLASLPAVPQLSRSQQPYDPMPVIRKHKLATPRAVVEHYARRLLAVPLRADQVSTLAAVLAVQGRLDAGASDAPERVRRMLKLMLSMPEAQLN